MEAIDRWREAIPAESRAETATAAALIGGSLIAGASVLRRERRTFFAWAIPGAILGAGIVMLLDVLLDARTERIEETEDRITQELEALDPVARAQVLRSVGEQQVRTVLHR